MDIQRQIDLPVGPRSLVPLRDFVNRCMDEAAFEPDQRRTLTAALDTALTSAALGPGNGERRGTLSVLLDINDTRMRVVIRDDTDGAELATASADAAVALATAQRRELGLSLLRRVMDEIRYTFTRGFQNELELIKFL